MDELILNVDLSHRRDKNQRKKYICISAKILKPITFCHFDTVKWCVWSVFIFPRSLHTKGHSN